MIFDKENMFMDKIDVTAIPAMSDVVANGAGGDAVNSLNLVVVVAAASGGSGVISAILETADDEGFTAPLALGTYTNVTGKPVIKVKLPIGCKKYLRIKPTTTYTAGAMTAGLVSDVDIH